jgi:CBS domain-containing protein
MFHDVVPSHEELLGEINAARDHARLELHRLSLDAKSAWNDIEGRLLQLQSSLERDGGELSETVVSRVRELTRSARDFIERRRRSPAGALQDTVDTVLTTEVVTCLLDDRLEHVARCLWDHDCGILPVLGPDHRVVGMITDRDVCMAAYTQGQPLAHISVQSAMSRALHACRPEDSVEHALLLMRRHRVRRLPVLSPLGHLLGLVSLGTLARRLETTADASSVVVRTLAGLSEPERVRVAPAE